MDESKSNCFNPVKASSKNGALVARTGRHQQRYENGYRLVAGCVPYRYKTSNDMNDNSVRKTIEVLMVTTQGGPGLLFPKGGWETDETAEEAACREAYEEAGVRGHLKRCLGTWDFKSKRQQGDCSPEGLCRAYMYPLLVSEELDSWPEQNARQRHWFSAAEAVEKCRYEWMQKVLNECITQLSNERQCNPGNPVPEMLDDNPDSNPLSDFPTQG